MFIGAIAGWSMGKATAWFINRARLEVEGLYPVLLLALMFFTFSVTGLIGGNGFLAVYIAGVILGNSRFVLKESLLKFYDGQAWLMQIIMFLTLGLFVFPKQLVPLIGIGFLFSAVLIFIARPSDVFIGLAFAKMKPNKLMFISWVGLR
jgi:potassium/hydrogen antiporter